MWMKMAAFISSVEVWATTLLVLTVMSVMCFCLSTHSAFRQPNWFRLVGNSSLACHPLAVAKNPKLRRDCTTLPSSRLIRLDLGLNTFFSLELALKFALAPDKRKFVCSIVFLFDIVILVVFWLQQAIFYFFYVYTEGQLMRQGDHTLPWLLNILFMAQALRMLRVFKISKISRGLRVLILTVKKSIPELVLLAFLLMNGMFMFSSMIYMAEYRVPDTFTDIPEAFWWSLVTLTTVGYGDTFPKGGWGYLVGSIAAISGCIVTGLAIPIIGNNFNTYYKYMQNQLKEDKYLRQLRRDLKQTAAACHLSSTLSQADRRNPQSAGLEGRSDMAMVERSRGRPACGFSVGQPTGLMSMGGSAGNATRRLGIGQSMSNSAAVVRRNRRILVAAGNASRVSADTDTPASASFAATATLTSLRNSLVRRPLRQTFSDYNSRSPGRQARKQPTASPICNVRKKFSFTNDADSPTPATIADKVSVNHRPAVRKHLTGNDSLGELNTTISLINEESDRTLQKRQLSPSLADKSWNNAQNQQSPGFINQSTLCCVCSTPPGSSLCYEQRASNPSNKPTFAKTASWSDKAPMWFDNAPYRQQLSDYNSAISSSPTTVRESHKHIPTAVEADLFSKAVVSAPVNSPHTPCISGSLKRTPVGTTKSDGDDGDDVEAFGQLPSYKEFAADPATCFKPLWLNDSGARQPARQVSPPSQTNSTLLGLASPVYTRLHQDLFLDQHQRRQGATLGGPAEAHRRADYV